MSAPAPITAAEIVELEQKAVDAGLEPDKGHMDIILHMKSDKFYKDHTKEQAHELLDAAIATRVAAQAAKEARELSDKSTGEDV